MLACLRSPPGANGLHGLLSLEPSYSTTHLNSQSCHNEGRQTEETSAWISCGFRARIVRNRDVACHLHQACAAQLATRQLRSQLLPRMLSSACPKSRGIFLRYIRKRQLDEAMALRFSEVIRKAITASRPWQIECRNLPFGLQPQKLHQRRWLGSVTSARANCSAVFGVPPVC